MKIINVTDNLVCGFRFYYAKYTNYIHKVKLDTWAFTLAAI